MAYNRVTKELAAEQGLPANDLFEASKDWGEEFYLDYCHMTKDGYQRLAQKVTEAVSACIYLVKEAICEEDEKSRSL